MQSFFSKLYSPFTSATPLESAFPLLRQIYRLKSRSQNQNQYSHRLVAETFTTFVPIPLRTQIQLTCQSGIPSRAYSSNCRVSSRSSITVEGGGAFHRETSRSAISSSSSSSSSTGSFYHSSCSFLNLGCSHLQNTFSLRAFASKVAKSKDVQGRLQIQNSETSNKEVLQREEKNMNTNDAITMMDVDSKPQAKANTVVLGNLPGGTIYPEGAIGVLLNYKIPEKLCKLESIFRSNGFEMRIIGGAVRDLLLGKNPKDFDVATNAMPEETIKILTENGIRNIPTGLQHGTITAVIDSENIEITTLRVDTVTDGRHAQVDFTRDWKLDAERRDLTINALALTFSNVVVDFFSGFEDLAARKIKFVGSAETRIREDYLRILRYFRFHGRICVGEAQEYHDKDTLHAIQCNAEGLVNISKERIWSELSKILIGNNFMGLLKVMLDSTVLKHIGFTKESQDRVKYYSGIRKEDSFRSLLPNLPNFKYQSVTRLSYFVPLEEWDFYCSHFKLSNAEKILGSFILLQSKRINEMTNIVTEMDKLKFCKDALAEGAPLDHVLQLTQHIGLFEPYIAELQHWIIPVFPLNGKMLQQNGIPAGKHMGTILREAKDHWKARNFEPDFQELLCKATSVYNSLK